MIADVIGDCRVLIFFDSVKELNEVGRDLPTRNGELEGNREKNRYPFILPCKCNAVILIADN